MAERRELTVGWLGQVDEEGLGDLIWDWLAEHGAKDLWLGCGPDKHPEDWDDAPDGASANG